MLSIDKYAYSSRLVQWAPTRKALIWLLGMVLAFQPEIGLKVVVTVLVAIWTVYVTKVRFRQYLQWYYAILPFLVLSILGIVVTANHQGNGFVWAIRIGNVYIGVSKTMLPIGIKVAFQSITAIVCTYWFALTTPFVQVIQVLKKIHFPRAMIELTMLMYRFIFIFIDSFQEIHRAQKLRFGYDNTSLMIHSSGILAKMLFEEVLVNYNQMVKALDAKLYNGNFYV